MGVGHSLSDRSRGGARVLVLALAAAYACGRPTPANMPPGAVQCTVGKAKDVCPSFRGCQLCLWLEDSEGFCAETCVLGDVCSGGRVCRKIDTALSFVGDCMKDGAGYCADAAPSTHP